MNNIRKTILPISLGVLFVVGLVIFVRYVWKLLGTFPQKQPQNEDLYQEALRSVHTPVDNSLNACDPSPTKVYKLPIGSNELVGMMYPPRLGPLHTGIQQPDRDSCRGPFTEIYDNKVVFNCAPNF